MSQPRPDIHQWQTWRIVASDDTPITVINPASYNAAARLKAIDVNPRFNAVVIKALGKDTNNDASSFKFTGFMDPDTDQKRTGAGPGAVLASGSMILGASTGSIIPLADGRWGSAATWFQVDTWTLTTNAAGAVAKVLADNQSDLILPTWGYKQILLEVTDMDGVSEMTEVGFMWRSLYVPGMSHISLVP